MGPQSSIVIDGLPWEQWNALNESQKRKARAERRRAILQAIATAFVIVGGFWALVAWAWWKSL